MDGLRVFFNRYVYFTLFVAFAAGVLTARYLPSISAQSAMLVGLLIVGLALVTFVFLRSFRLVDERLVLGIFYALVFTVGLFYMWLHLALMNTSPLSAFSGESVEVTGRVQSFPRLSEKGQSFFLRVDKISSPGLSYSHPKGVGKVYVFIRDGRDLPISYGYEVRFRGDLKEADDSANRRGFSMRDYLFPFGVRYQILVPSPAFVDYAREANTWSRGLYLLKSHLIRQADRWFIEPHRTLFIGLLLGDSAIYFPRYLKDTFRLAGLTHLLVVSGTQVSLLFLFISLLFLRIESSLTPAGRAIRTLKYILAIGFILTYAVLTGFEPSIQRAFVVSLLVMGAHFFIYEADSFNLLGQAGIILLLMKPMELFSVSFQLTFAATLGLILALRVFRPYIGYIPSWGRGLAAVFISTAGAQVLVSPFLALYFNQVSLWGLISNLIAIPVSFFVILLGLVFYIISPIPLLASFTAFILRWLVHFLYAWAQFFSVLPGSNFHFAPVSAPFALIILGLLFTALVAIGWSKHYSRWWQSAGCIAVSGLVLAGIFTSHQFALPNMRVLFLSSGSAAALVKPDRSAIVFLDLPASAERQNGLLDDLYWLLSKDGVSRISAIVILGQEELSPSTLENSPLKAASVVHALSGTAQPMRPSAGLPSSLDWYFNEKEQIALFSVSMGSTQIVLPPTQELRSRLDVQLPQADSGVRTERRVLILPGAAARKQSSAVESFLEANQFEVVVLQGWGRIPDALLPFTVDTVILTQAERREIDIRKDGSVDIL